MKLNNNHKIILGLAIGGGIAWWLTRKKSATTSNTATINNANAEDLSREDKIAYIVENIQANENVPAKSSLTPRGLCTSPATRGLRACPGDTR